MNEYFYNFQFGNVNHGYYYLQIGPASIYSHTRFIQPDQNLYINVFRLKLQNDRVSAYQYRDQPWVDFSQFPENAYPSSAYPLWVDQATSFPFRYLQVDESKDQVIGTAVVEQIGNQLIEKVDGLAQRRFTLEDAQVIKIDWGGPTSILCKNADEAIHGSNVQFELNQE